ncbi:UvrD-helicase domain-containing protein [Candidatus Nomurabacteria bacterium]|nr:UvrD-helicase domain-containing protein [Candidatus Nomurabacteria bacterium]
MGVHIIKENAKVLGLTRYFSILDEDDAKSLIKEALKELNFDPKEHSPAKIKAIISIEKGKFVTLEKYKENAQSFFQELVANVWKIYEDKKAKENSLDFDDLLLKTVNLLKDNEQIRKIYQEKWEYIHIDEYQDTNEVQYLMSKLLAENNRNIAVVGDADQNIYSWRGANLKNILSFEKDYPNSKIVLLEENYRSTKNILEAANEIIKKNKYRPDKNLFTENETGEKISIYEALDEADEADFVATKILELMDRREDTPERTLGMSDDDGQRKFSVENFRGESGSILSEIAVLYRANFQSRALEEAMLRYNIPYQVLGVKFFERKEIKDTLAYLRAALNKENSSDIKRIINFPKRGIGKATLEKIFGNEIESLPAKTRIKINNFYKILEDIKEKIQSETASQVIKFVVKNSGIEEELLNGTDEDVERLQNIKELATLALKYDNLPNGLGIEKLLEDAALASDQDSLILNDREKVEKSKKNGIKLMTVHASKGLEFKYVFIVGLEDGLFPNRRDGEIKNKEDAEEERRLFYVALTRAKEKLFLSFANFRTIFGSRQINAASEFITDIPADLLEKEGEKDRIKTIYL